MNILIYSDDQTKSLKERIDKELDLLQDRLTHFGSSVINDVDLKSSYRINSQKDGFEIDTNLDAALVLLIKQTIRLCLSTQQAAN